jgi:integrase
MTPMNLKDRKHRTEGFRVPLVQRAVENGRPGQQPADTAHGFRATFRTWAEEVATFPHAVVEQAMGHQVGTVVERAYRRTDVLEKRRQLMETWAHWCERKADNVIAFGEGRRS